MSSSYKELNLSPDATNCSVLVGPGAIPAPFASSAANLNKLAT